MRLLKQCFVNLLIISKKHSFHFSTLNDLEEVWKIILVIVYFENDIKIIL